MGHIRAFTEEAPCYVPQKGEGVGASECECEGEGEGAGEGVNEACVCVQCFEDDQPLPGGRARFFLLFFSLRKLLPRPAPGRRLEDGRTGSTSLSQHLE